MNSLRNSHVLSVGKGFFSSLLEQTLEAIVAHETFRADELPQPAANERQPPGEQALVDEHPELIR